VLTISEFAQACGLSVPALRRYDEAGVLVPAEVDQRTGYRRYAPEQISAGVLVRTLRQIGLPLATIGTVRAAADPAAALEPIEQHWAGVERGVAAGRQVRDHLARLLDGSQPHIRTHRVEVREVGELAVLLRRRRVTLMDVPALLAESVGPLTAPAERDGLPVTGCPVVLYRRTVGHDDVEDDGSVGQHDIEVCLPVAREGDAVLPGGRFAATELAGEAARPPRLLTGYGAVSHWAHERGEVLTGHPLEVHLGGGRLRVGWLVRPRAGSPPPDRWRRRRDLPGEVWER
jgi:DNA-binding transcriptional MerR regulator